MPFVIATHIVERGEAFQLGEKCGSDVQILVFLWGYFTSLLLHWLYRVDL
jgi:hypothetical protein